MTTTTKREKITSITRTVCWPKIRRYTVLWIFARYCTIWKCAVWEKTVYNGTENGISFSIPPTGGNSAGIPFDGFVREVLQTLLGYMLQCCPISWNDGGLRDVMFPLCTDVGMQAFIRHMALPQPHCYFKTCHLPSYTRTVQYSE